MKFVDCIWEMHNLGERVCEIGVEKDDVFDKRILSDLTEGFQYVVVKVPVNRPDFNFGLSEMGYAMIETQLNISKKYKDFDFEDRLVRRLYPNVYENIVNTEEELEDVLGRVTPNMFSTDRIYLDSHFDRRCSNRRYANWTRSEFKGNKAVIKEIIFEGVKIGFEMYRKKDDIIYGLLGGIYEDEQSEGLGLLTACIGFLTAKKENDPFKKVVTSISANNVPMVQIYNYLNFKIDNMTYVFVKHQ